MFKRTGENEQLRQMFLGTINITEPCQVYVRSVELNEAGDRAPMALLRQRLVANRRLTTGALRILEPGPSRPGLFFARRTDTNYS